MATFGERLRFLRNKKSYSMAEFAKLMNAGKTTISNWENNNRFPDRDTLIKLANFFDVTLDFLLGRTDDPDTLLLTNKKLDLPKPLQGLGLDENLPVPKEYDDKEILITADRKTMPKELNEEIVNDILNFLIDQGYEIKPKAKTRK